jgi:hypothetical protein
MQLTIGLKNDQINIDGSLHVLVIRSSYNKENYRTETVEPLYRWQAMIVGAVFLISFFRIAYRIIRTAWPPLCPSPIQGIFRFACGSDTL